MRITLVAGARPNFMKIAPLIEAIHQFNQAGSSTKIAYRLIHTGQHYDPKLSQTFFEELNIPAPHNNLEVGSGTQAEQTGAIMVRFEQELLAHRPDVVVVVGDVTSTMACAITAKKLCIDVAHVEAGIRSGDRTMPEEINRVLTDAICDHFFTTTEWAGANLLREGVAAERIHLVGNTMIDTLLANMDRLRAPALWQERQLQNQGYFVLTLHRPANVDQERKFLSLMQEITSCVGDLPIVFPVHPRTAKVLRSLAVDFPNLIICEPLGYLEFNFLVKYAKGVITDSGGITEETTVMGVPCLTLRNTTERPETVAIGTNELVGDRPAALAKHLQKILAGQWKKGAIPPLWDGRTAGRILEKLMTWYGVQRPTVTTMT